MWLKKLHEFQTIITAEIFSDSILISLQAVNVKPIYEL
jgi:hypothetical protein